MEIVADFNSKLTKGQLIEVGVKNSLQNLLPDCEVINTIQSFGSPDRDTYHLCDVVVLKDGKPILGVECKRSTTKLECCKNKYGWDGDYNTPLNSTSIRKYLDSDFPFYVLNINQFCKKVFVANIDDIKKSWKGDKGIVKPSGVIIRNFDSSSWMKYEGDDIHMSVIMNDILKREKIC